MKPIYGLLGSVLFSLLGASAYATTVSYAVNNLAAHTWRYDFSVDNNTLGIPITEFTIFFDAANFSNLEVAQSPLTWDPVIAQPDTGLPDDGYFDALALADGIAPGAKLGGFSVLADFAGTGTPGALRFTIVDPVNFAVPLEAGVTIVPVPGALALFASGLLGMGWRRRSPAAQRG